MYSKSYLVTIESGDFTLASAKQLMSSILERQSGIDNVRSFCFVDEMDLGDELEFEISLELDYDSVDLSVLFEEDMQVIAVHEV